MSNLKISVSPHIHSGRSTMSIMRDVLISLAPASVAGCIIFGWRALLVLAVCVASSVLFEYLFCLVAKKERTVDDLSAAVTGLLLGLNLPANIPIWQCVIGSLFAIVVVKCIFGGIGNNLVNPAIAARVFMLVAFSSVAKAAYPTIVDTTSSATPLAEMAEGKSPDLLSLLLGTTGGAIGETCAIALLAGFVYLLVRRIISWHITTAFVGTVFVLSFFISGFDIIEAVAMLLSGGLLIGAIFMATDYVTSPTTWAGKLIFGFGAGLMTVLIRYFGTYPEGVSFAILFMNILTPYIDVWTRHKVFGGAK